LASVAQKDFTIRPEGIRYLIERGNNGGKRREDMPQEAHSRNALRREHFGLSKKHIFACTSHYVEQKEDKLSYLLNYISYFAKDRTFLLCLDICAQVCQNVLSSTI
jgi:hypothetical protein